VPGRPAPAPDRFRRGAIAIFLVAGAYTVAIAVLHAAGARITIPAWVPIPEDRYYLVEALYIGPLTVVLWLAAGHVAHRMAHRVGGRGTARSTQGLIALAIAVPSLATLLPDLVTGLLFLTGALPQDEWLEMTSGGFWQVVVIGYLSLYLVGIVALFPVAVRASEGVSRRAAVLVGLLSLSVYQVPYFILVR
jgi:hypothetical protein